MGYNTILEKLTIYVHFSDETFGTNMYTCNIMAQFNTTTYKQYHSHTQYRTDIDVGYNIILEKLTIYVHFSDETFGTNMYTCNIVAQFNTTSHLVGTVVRCRATPST